MRKKITTNIFIERSKNSHNNKYDYFNTEYINMNTKVKIICNKHGEFEQLARIHLLEGCGCPECGVEKRTKKITMNHKTFIKNANKFHNNKYDYSRTEYINMNTKIKIICPFHKEFLQTPFHHIHNSGCKKCADEQRAKNQILTLQTFIKNANKSHNNKYDYSLVEYKNDKIKVNIICPIHGIFKKTPNLHIHQCQGCPKCKSTKGEQKIINWLEKNNINYIYNKKFKNYDIRPDFYLQDYNIIIEYDGIQHFKDNIYFKTTLKEQQNQDKYKNDIYNLCDMKIIRIPYINYLQIESILKKGLFNILC